MESGREGGAGNEHTTVCSWSGVLVCLDMSEKETRKIVKNGRPSASSELAMTGGRELLHQHPEGSHAGIGLA